MHCNQLQPTTPGSRAPSKFEHHSRICCSIPSRPYARDFVFFLLLSLGLCAVYGSSGCDSVCRFSISVVQDGQVRHIRITNTGGKFAINREEAPCNTLCDLINQKMKEKLKSTLQVRVRVALCCTVGAQAAVLRRPGCHSRATLIWLVWLV